MSSDLSQREVKVLQTLQFYSPCTIKGLAVKCFSRERPFTRAESRVRNALRRLVEARIVKRVAPGTYKAIA